MTGGQIHTSPTLFFNRSLSFTDVAVPVFHFFFVAFHVILRWSADFKKTYFITPYGCRQLQAHIAYFKNLFDMFWPACKPFSILTPHFYHSCSHCILQTCSMTRQPSCILECIVKIKYFSTLRCRCSEDKNDLQGSFSCDPYPLIPLLCCIGYQS